MKVLNLYQVLSAYCNPDAVVSFSTPTAVSAYITDIPEFDYLAPCAKSALRYAVGYEPSSQQAIKLSPLADRKQDDGTLLDRDLR